MLRKRINRYVDRVVYYLPILERRRARVIITDAIYARLDYLTDGAKPTAHDLRLVLREMGDPASLAEAYYDDFHKSLFQNVDLRKSLHRCVTFLTVVALLFVTVGIGRLVTGAEDLMVLAWGGALGLVIVLYQMLIQPRMETLVEGSNI